MSRRGRNSTAARPTPSGENGMTHAPRLRSLEERHRVLDQQIGQQDARPRPDELELQRLKREKLRLKEEIERLRRHA